MEPLYITEEEFEYYSKPIMLNEGNMDNTGEMTKEEYEREIQNCISLEEFSRLWEESINRIMSDS